MLRGNLVPGLITLGFVAVMIALIAGGSAPTVATAQAPVVLKMQASWPASLTIFDHFKFVAERVDKLSGGTLKIEPLPAGTIVPAFEVLDATNKKVIDGAHTVAYYWVGKNKTAVLFTGGPGATSGWTSSTSSAGCTRAAGSSCTSSSTKTS
jgi:TRAP-type mannitol/chloroaromatic compound transport system substrate-binding protein